ncbi:MAG: A/G-specific adenine glycosylase [Ferruginibacter sp.]
MKIQAHQKIFVKNLLKWNRNDNTREMPWKGEKDPYKIWLSEIILQQTRVEQGMDYYHRFVKTFPTISHLARAAETKVFKLWEGLGYYTRCKNLLATAKYINDDREGKFPDKYEEILALKGVGTYTAAAIASFAFNLPYAVLDGNVSRVLSRYFGISIPVDSNGGKRLFSALANDLLDKKHPGLFNQALMDFGAVICRPQLPLCATCILKRHCNAFLQGSVQQLPLKKKSITKKIRWFYYLLIELNGEVFVRKRSARDIWENLYEFILLEAKDEQEVENFQLVKEFLGKTRFNVVHISVLYKQQLTHQTILGKFIHIRINKPLLLAEYKTVGKKALYKLPFPKFISNYLKDKNVSLNLV